MESESWRVFLQSPPRHSAERAAAIVAEAPDAIDVVNARHGETLRYFGLPFARVRSLLGNEKSLVWNQSRASPFARRVDMGRVAEFASTICASIDQLRRSIIVMRSIAQRPKRGSNRCCEEISRSSIPV